MSTNLHTGNRAARRTGGRHRKAQQQAGVALVASAAVAAGLALAPTAGADPIQGGTTGGNIQGGTTSTPAPAPAPEPYVPEAPAEPVYWVEAPVVQPTYVPKPNYDYGTNTYTGYSDYVAPIDYTQLHAPVAVEPAPMYIAPKGTVMIGDYQTVQPNWMTDEDLERTNNTAELMRSQVSTAWRSVGVEPERADRVAAAQVGGAAVGALTGAAIGAVPGALLGGNIGGNAGLAIGGLVSIPLPPPLPAAVVVPTTVAGTAAGAAIGGAITAVPGAIFGGAAGFTAGTAFGGGDDKGEPIPFDLPDIDEAAITEQTETTLTQWEQSGPVGQAAATAVRDTVAAAPAIDQQARDWAAAQPGGQQVVDAIDGALAQFGGGSAGVATQMISGAIGTGIGA
ncbi:insoluble domain protein [Prescottella subtropica]|uniref:insoluble domain protein n=1 Tax=Prescottella subtropica TaxID=2545757 RepID=UPI0010F995C9|nr:insoluble domain protein [Prescottella subtropica]